MISNFLLFCFLSLCVCIKFCGKFQSAEVLESCTLNSRFPRLISPARKQSNIPGDDGEDTFLEVTVDKSPLDNPNVDLRLALKMKSLDIYLNMFCVQQIG